MCLTLKSTSNYTLVESRTCYKQIGSNPNFPNLSTNYMASKLQHREKIKSNHNLPNKS